MEFGPLWLWECGCRCSRLSSRNSLADRQEICNRRVNFQGCPTQQESFSLVINGVSMKLRDVRTASAKVVLLSLLGDRRLRIRELVSCSYRNGEESWVRCFSLVHKRSSRYLPQSIGQYPNALQNVLVVSLRLRILSDVKHYVQISCSSIITLSKIIIIIDQYAF